MLLHTLHSPLIPCTSTKLEVGFYSSISWQLVLSVKVAPIMGLAYRISAYRPAFTHIGIGSFVTGTADNELRTLKQIVCMCSSVRVVW